MARFFTKTIFLGLILSLIRVSQAQMPNEGLRLKQSSRGGELSWWRRSGINYFIQSSEDLILWLYELTLETGADQEVSVSFTSSAQKHFFRLKMSPEFPASGYYPTPLIIAFPAGTDGNSRIRFTLDGSDPLENSPSIEGQFLQLNSRTRLKTECFIDGRPVGEIQEGSYLIRGKTIWAHGDSTIGFGAIGTTWIWGADGAGQAQGLPTAISYLKGVNEIGVGSDQWLSYWSGASLRTWGDNTFGQLGNGSRFGDLDPVAVFNGAQVEAIAAGDGFSVALMESGDVYTWGAGYSGQLGVGPLMTWSLVPVKVGGIPKIQKIAGGRSTVYAIDMQGNLWVWGDNTYSQAGGELSRYLVPTQIEGIGSPVIEVSAGATHALALTKNGIVYSWGANWYGQLGRRDDAALGVVTFGLNVPEIARIVSGDYHNLALTSEGTVYAWGAGWSGQTGQGDAVDQIEPQPIGMLSDILDIAAGRAHSVALGKEGTVYTWGDNTRGQLGKSGTESTGWPQRIELNLFKQ